MSYCYIKYKTTCITILTVRIFSILSFVLVGYFVHAQVEIGTLDEATQRLESSQARFDFYQGVNLLNSGYIAESLVAFQRSISIQDLPLYSYMYARANRSYGLESISNSIMRSLISNNFETSFLQSKIELVQTLQEGSIKDYTFSQLIRADSFNLLQWGHRVPMTLRILPNGDIAVVFLQSHEVLVLSPTGRIKYELNSGIIGFLNPTDVLYTHTNKFLVTSFKNDEIMAFSDEGIHLNSFLQIQTDQAEFFAQNFIGPQFLTQDNEDNIYVTTYGSARVFKFSSKGEYILNFGVEDNSFKGLVEPTGIEVIENTVVVADYTDQGTVLNAFDVNGNFMYMNSIASKKIESIRKINNTQLLLTTSDRVLMYDFSRKLILEEFALADFSRLISADFDSNNLLWIVDQGRGRIEAYSYLSGQYSGLDVNITTIDTQEFPNVILDVSIKDAFGTPLIGLEKTELTVFENTQSVSQIEVKEESRFGITNESVIIIPSTLSLNYKDDYTRMVEVLNNVTQKGQKMTLENEAQVRYWLLETNQLPQYVISESSISKDIIDFLPHMNTLSTTSRDFVNSLRFACNTLLTRVSKKTLLIVGDLPPLPKGQQNKEILLQWQQLKDLLSNHNISLVWVDVRLNPLSEIPSYFLNILQDDQNMQFTYLDYDIMKKIQSHKNKGTYQIHYKSSLTQDFAVKFIPLELESYFFTRSGKDVTGFMLPNWDE